MTIYKHILFATDLAQDTQYLIDKVSQLRQLMDAKLSIIHVIEPLPGYSYAYLGVEDIEGQLMDEAANTLNKLADNLNVPQQDRHIVVGPTKVKIHETADQVKADLIICGSHGRHGLSLLLGSTATAILHGAKCDVLTVRLPEEV